MDESFWFLAGEDDVERPETVIPASVSYDDFRPVSEPMRGARRYTRAPSTDEKRIKRQIHRSGAFHTDRMPPEKRVSDWDEIYGSGKNPDDWKDWSMHRGMMIWPTGDTHDRVNDRSRPIEDRAHELVEHLKATRPNAGMHWSGDEDFAKQVATDGGWSAIGNNGAPPGMQYALRMPVVLHAKWPGKEHMETDPQTLHHNHVLPFDYNENLAHEWEMPIKHGAPVQITGVSWSKYSSPRRHEWEHHTFDKPIEHLASKIGTVLNTQVERLNKGDQIRTPTGQVAEVTSRPRPHETDSGKVYIDTDMGTTLVDRGTDFQVVPRNSQQQELPDVGNVAGGNTAQLPGAGSTPGGPGTSKLPGANQAISHAACPNCGNTGTLSLHGNQFVCSVCGFQIAAGGSPGGLTFTNWPSGVMPPRKKPGQVPKAHVWASRNATLRDEGNVIARRARQVLDKEDM